MNIKYKLFPHQLKLLNSKAPITYMVCGRAAGKSYAASLLIVKYFLEGKRVIALAQTFKSLTEVLFAEVEARLRELGIDYVYNRGAMKMEYGEGVIFGASYENLESIRGLSMISLAVCDEAALSPNKLFTILSPCLRGKGIEGKIRLLSTPRRGSWLNLYCKEHPDLIEIIHATTRDNKFITEDQIKLMTDSIVNSDLLEQEIGGVMLDLDSVNSIVQYKDYSKVRKPYNPDNVPTYIGIDLAGLGADSNVITVANQFEIVTQKVLQNSNTFELSSTVEMLVHEYNTKRIFIDITGSSSCGVYDMLKAKNYEVMGINFAHAAFEKEKYANTRCEMYTELAKAIRSGMFIDDDDIKTQLSFTTVFVNNSGKMQLCKKEEIKETIGHSPDKADSLALAIYAMNHECVDQMTDKQADEVADEYLKLMGY